MGSVASVCFENMALPVGAWFLFILFATISPMGRRRVRIRIRRRERGAVSPAVAFAVLVVVLAAALIGFALLEKDDESGRPAPSPAGTLPTDEDDLSLTDAEAIARFEELDDLRRRAYREGNVTLLNQVFAPDGPTYEIVKGEIELLRSEAVESRTAFRTRKLAVIRNTPSTVEIRQRVLIRPKFIDATGTDVTGAVQDEIQTIVWTMVLDGRRWLIDDSVVVSTQPVS